MPIGTYRVMDGEGVPNGEVERFRCAPGPAGWRSVSEIDAVEPHPHAETVDITVDADWRPVRLRLDTGEHQLLARPAGDRLEIDLDGERRDLDWDPETELDYRSPAFNAVTVNRLHRASVTAADLSVVFFEPFTCEPRIVPQRYELLDDGPVTTPVGEFQAERWRYTALDTGWTRAVWIAGDVVVAYEGAWELVEYEPGAHGAIPH
ncbi:MAG: putative glycolipid-binding domain-containing protein [Actinomycetota bacterium]